jgi:hypothetical protein
MEELLGKLLGLLTSTGAGLKEIKKVLLPPGRRKSWHLFGTLCVVLTFPFIFLKCVECEDSDQGQILQ